MEKVGLTSAAAERKESGVKKNEPSISLTCEVNSHCYGEDLHSLKYDILR